MKTKHTPGPWTIQKPSNAYLPTKLQASEYILNQNVGLIACVSQRGLDENNAKIIAAAPDLLEALQLCVNHIDKGHAHYIKAKEAIKKATL